MHARVYMCVAVGKWVGAGEWVGGCLCVRTSAGKELTLGFGVAGSSGVEDAVELWGGETHGRRTLSLCVPC